MKGLRIIFGFMLMGLLLGLSLPVSALLPAEEEKTVPKTPQGDTVRMVYNITSSDPCYFSFYGEQDATYRVIWGDGGITTVTGKGPNTAVECGHRYSSYGTYTVLLFGVGTVEKK